MTQDREAIARILLDMQKCVTQVQVLLDKANAPDQGLYVRRRLLPQVAQAFRTWAIGEGFQNVLPAEELHVTIVYSKRAIAWTPLTNVVRVYADKGLSPRSVGTLGERGAIVLRFESSALAERWDRARERGAVWAYDGYHPHVTITYTPGTADLAHVVPFRGVLEFGPEVAAPIDDTWWLDHAKPA